MKVVIDTNVLISLLFGKSLRYLKEKIKKREINLIISTELLSELTDVLKRPKFRLLDEEDKRDLFFVVEDVAIRVASSERICVCRDAKDNIVLECAVAGKAEYIITGDRDILVLSSFKGIKIISPKGFKKLLK